MFGIDGELIRWAATGIATVGAWLIGRHDKLRAAKARRDAEAKQAEEQRKREQVEARRAAKALAEAVAAKNAEIDALHRDIDYYRSQYDKLFTLYTQCSAREVHG